MKQYFLLILMLTVCFFANAQADIGKSETIVQTTKAIKVKIFPNPATNVVNVLGLQNTSQADIIISDIYGNTVLARKWAIRRNALNIPISDLKTGAYIIQIHSEKEQVRTKFYKQ